VESHKIEKMKNLVSTRIKKARGFVTQNLSVWFLNPREFCLMVLWDFFFCGREIFLLPE